MIDVEKITMIEWIIGGGLFTFLCLALWRLLRAAGDAPVTREIQGFDIQAYKLRR